MAKSANLISDVADPSLKRQKRGVPEGLWIQCDGCKSTVYRKQVEQNLYCCPECQHHFYVPAKVRIEQLLDEESFEEWYGNLTSKPKSAQE